MAEQGKKSDTMRIDLLPNRPEAPQTQPKGPLTSMTRMNWTPPTRTLHYVARSQYKELLQSLYDAAVVTDLAGDIVDVNNRAEEFLQYDSSDLRKMNIAELIDGADESLIDRLRESLENERHCLIEAYCIRSDGSEFPAEIAVNKLRLENLSLCFFIRDITVRMQAQEMLQLEHHALQIAGSGTLIVDLDGVIVYANPAFAGMVGVNDCAELNDQNAWQFFSDSDAAEAMVQHVMQSGETIAQEVAMRRTSGDDIFAQVSATCNRNEDGNALGIVLSFADITEQRRLRGELEQRFADQTTQYEETAERMRREIEDLRSSALEEPNA